MFDTVWKLLKTNVDIICDFYSIPSQSIRLVFNSYNMHCRLTIIVDDSYEATSTGDHKGRKTKTDPPFGYYLGGLRRGIYDIISDKDNSVSWSRFIGCMSDVSIDNVMVDFAVSQPTGMNADFSRCPVPDPVDPEVTTLTPGQLGKI